MAMMFDKDALYIAAYVKDKSPMMNRHDPMADAARAWDGDSCQVRLMLDPKLGFPLKFYKARNSADHDQIIHLMLWYYTDRKEPALQMDYGIRHKPPKTQYNPVGVVSKLFSKRLHPAYQL